MPEFSELYTLLVVACGAGLLGAISGLVGTVATLKRQSLLADTVSHAALPGIVLAFILTGVRSHPVFLSGALIAGFCAAVQMLLLVKGRKLRQDSSLSLLLAVYFGFGMVLLSHVQHQPNAAQAGLETFLFGEAATMLITDVHLIAIVGLIILYVFILFSKEIFIVAFDANYAEALGFSTFKLDVIFVLIVVANVTVGLQTVGVVLMSAMIVAPASAARQWSNRLTVIAFLSMLMGAFAGIAGSILSSYLRLPTGPTIIIIISLIAFTSFFLAPKRGIFWALLKKQIKHNNAVCDDTLSILYQLSLQHNNPYHSHPVHVIEALCPRGRLLLDELEIRGLAESPKIGFWAITEQGIEKIRRRAQ